MTDSEAARGKQANVPPRRLTRLDGAADQSGDRRASGRQPVNVALLLNDVAALVADMFPKSIRIEKNVPSDLWRISGDLRQVEQVLFSFCIHARDAMPAGGTLKLRASNFAPGISPGCAAPAEVRGPHVLLEIAVTGSGIKPEIFERITLQRVTTAEKRSDIGLSTVLGVVRAHDGVLQIEAAPLRHTTFRVYLPATRRSEPGGSAR